MLNRRQLSMMIGVCLATAWFGQAHAQEYPNKPIRLVVAYPPGGSTDILARIVSKKMTELLGQPVIVDNRGGASGIIAGEIVARAAPDGYTLLITGNGPYAINPSLFKNLPYDSAKDFVPISLVAKLPLLLVAPASLPVNSVSALIAQIKSKHEPHVYASIGPGTPSHLAMEVFKEKAGVELTHVPYKGSGPALVALVGGQEAPIMFDSVVSSLPHVKSGKLKVLAVGSAERLALLPKVPTVAESGLEGFDVSSWVGIFAPAGTVPAKVALLSNTLTKILASAEVSEKIAAQGGIVGKGGAQEFSVFANAEIEKWRKIVQNAKIQPE